MSPSIIQVRVVQYVLAGIGLVTTAIRLFLRFRRYKLWWDDFWVLIAAICTIALMVASFYHDGPPDSTSQHSKVIYYWLCFQFWNAITWTSRLSMLCTIIRIATPGSRMKLFLKISAAFFVISWVILTAQVFWVCAPERIWKEVPLPQCDLGANVAIAQIITCVVADAILIYAPIQFIWGTRFPQTTKIRLIAVFAATLIITVASMCYIYIMLKITSTAEDVAAAIQNGLSLIVANLSVITSFIFALLSPASSDDDAEAAHPWHAPRRVPVRSFPFISTIQSPYRGEVAVLPTHVNLHERDFQMKSVMPQLESESELGIKQYGVQEGRLELAQNLKKEGEGEGGGGQDVR